MRHVLKTAAAISLFCLTPFVSGSARDSIPLLLKAAEAKALSAATLKSEFTLTIIWVLKDTTERKQGSLILKKPSKYRVDLGDAVYVNDGKSISRFSPGLRQLVVQHASTLGDDFSPGEWLFRYSDRFYSSEGVTESISGISCESFILTPKQKDRFQKVEVSISLSDSLPRRIKTTDINGNEAEYLLKSMKLNTSVSDRVFRFSPPKGTEVIDLREEQEITK